ncbi:MAG: hypothetical protein KJN84_16135 [Bacteroidia bacterium]|nr:hypothetical protein [Bacteroidia bacterium]
MHDITPGWHTTIYPFYYILGMLLSFLAVFMLVWYIVIKILKIKKERYEGQINIANLVFCILSTVLLASYVSELVMALYSGYINEQFSFFNQAIGPYWILYMVLMWLPLLLTQFFWRKKYRVNINLALFIIFMFNLQLWLERIYVIVNSLL